MIYLLLVTAIVMICLFFALKKWLLPRSKRAFLGIVIGVWTLFFVFVFFMESDTLAFSTPQAAYRFKQLPFSSSPVHTAEGEDSVFLLTEDLISSGIVAKKEERYRVYSARKVQTREYCHELLGDAIVYVLHLEGSGDYYIKVRGRYDEITSLSDSDGNVFDKQEGANGYAWYGRIDEPHEGYVVYINGSAVRFSELTLLTKP